ncbi:DNA methyltransferase [Synechococcales cyanobacterium C]|uniref:site-specific DNA-methyltransferase (cytosine-N(4)-specific) n=1 Tax=Petrachloros mirabilis ULC683 TaxID=2781853 RepID=A0A8K1ZYI3_9CYAN|nr:DNA methyltransferase [Petrachloros mirabilis]NCJ06341.1 DNA methyltransferase [Petrachloros mirabilis ULC683]
MVSPVPDLQTLQNFYRNQLHEGDRAFHDWYRFILSFPPHLVRAYIDQFGLTADAMILDPFCGTGTTLVEAKKCGIPAMGIEANPMAHFASQTKNYWQLTPERVMAGVDRVLAQAIAEPVTQDLLRFTPEQEALLLKNSICDRPLHQCLLLANAIAELPDPLVQNLCKLALADVAVQTASNLKFGPEVGIRRTKVEDADVLAAWQLKVTEMAADLGQVQGQAMAITRCDRGDARRLSLACAPESIDAVITSPPYPNEKDYTRTTRLESVLLGFLRNQQDLRHLKQSLLRSNTRNVFSADQDDAWIAENPNVLEVAAAIEERKHALQKTSGFERLYSRVVTLYFGGMKRHLADLRPILRPGAQLAYVVGDQASFLQVLVRTGELLADVAESLGYEVVSLDLFRTRVSSKTGEHLREEVVRLQWRGGHTHRQNGEESLY